MKLRETKIAENEVLRGRGSNIDGMLSTADVERIATNVVNIIKAVVRDTDEKVNVCVLRKYREDVEVWACLGAEVHA